MQKISSPKQFFKSVKIIHFAMMTGILFFGIIAFILNYSCGQFIENKELENVLLLVVVVFLLAEVIGSNFIFKYQLKECYKQTALKDKLLCYRSALIVRIAMIEGVSFFVIIAYVLTGNFLFLVFLVLLLFIFLLFMPTLEKTRTDLKLNYDEEKQMYNDDDFTK